MNLKTELLDKIDELVLRDIIPEDIIDSINSNLQIGVTKLYNWIEGIIRQETQPIRLNKNNTSKQNPLFIKLKELKRYIHKRHLSLSQ